MKSGVHASKSLAIGVSLMVYIVTIVLVFYAGSQFNHFHVLWQIAIADLTGTIIIFLFSILFNNSSMYDPYWSVKPIVIATFYFITIPIGEKTIFQILFLLLIGLYALRLTANFYQGWSGLKHEDWRYRNFREKFPGYYWLISFFGIHLFPTIMVYLGCLPMYVIFSQQVAFPWLTFFGVFILFGSVLLAYIADQQLRKFRLNPDNEGKTITTGLWSRSRHPNYLGEILSWWGLFFLALGCGLEFWWTGIGALTITLMFLFISIPIMEKRAISKRADFKDYHKSVPMLFPKIF